MVHEAVQEVAVVGDDDKGAFELQKILFQNVQRDDVKVIGGLVQDKEIGPAHEHRQEVKPPPFASGEPLHGGVQHLVREKEASQKVGVVDGFKDGLPRLEFHSLLPVIAYPQGLSVLQHTLLPTAPGSVPKAAYEVEEGGFSGGVGPDYADSFVSLEVI